MKLNHKTITKEIFHKRYIFEYIQFPKTPKPPNIFQVLGSNSIPGATQARRRITKVYTTL